MTKEVLLDLAARCEHEGPSPRLDYAICVAVGDTEALRSRTSARHYTRSLDAAVTLIPPNTYWTVGKGKETDDEPLYGAIIETAARPGQRVELGVGESGKHEALALCAAALRAKAAQ